MTLKELLSSVSAEEYTDYPLYQELLKVKPEYGSSRHIEVKMVNGEIAIYNVHIGSLGDIVTYPIDVDPDLQVTKIQLLDAILAEMTSQNYGEEEYEDENYYLFYRVNSKHIKGLNDSKFDTALSFTKELLNYEKK